MITRGSRLMLHSWGSWAYTFWLPLYSAIDFFTRFTVQSKRRPVTAVGM